MIYLALGSNLGDRLGNLRTSLNYLSEFFKIEKSTIVFETAAILPEGAPKSWDLSYFNMVVAGTTDLDPFMLLKFLKDIERKMGRMDEYQGRWSPRSIDLDIVFYNNDVIDTPNLTVPHKEINNRDFLIALLELLGADLTHIRNPITEEIDYSPLASLVLEPKLVGIVNITPDSFSDGGDFFNIDRAIDRVNDLYNSGASVIEIGGQSTRPEYNEVPKEKELERIEPILEICAAHNTSVASLMGIDSYFDDVIKCAISKYNVSWVNDIYGGLQSSTIKLVADKGAKLVVMLQGVESSQLMPRINILENLGIKKENIIIDPGIGFAKSRLQSLKFIKNLKNLKEDGYQIMLGHSRKSFLSLISSLPAKKRDIETIAISNFASEIGVDYLRIHNVRDHMRFFAAEALIENIDF